MQKEISNALSFAISKGYQIHPDAFAMLKGLDIDILKAVQDIVRIKVRQKGASFILVEDIKNLINTEGKSADVNGVSSNTLLNTATPIIDVNHLSSSTTIASSSDFRQQQQQQQHSSKVLLDSTPSVNSGEGVNGYTSLFRSRFEKSLHILALRPDSKRITKIASLKRKSNNTRSRKSYEIEGDPNKNSSSVVAGLLMSKRSKKNGLEMTIDDYSGMLNVLAITEELKRQASMLALDQMVMLEVDNANKKGMQGFIVKNLVSPDIPDHLPNRSKSESYVILTSDLHVGSKYFLEVEFLRFLSWLSSTEDEIIGKIKFVCIGGDIIDGIGIFPNQEKELIEMDTGKQMSHAIDLLAKIPQHIKVFIIPGNHDPGRRALPQPALPRKHSDKLYSFENFAMLGNPSLLELNSVKILMYHGQSLDDIIATTPGLSYSRPAEAMKVLLKARHLSPIYGERTPIGPELEDMMVITEVPDIFHSGHVHSIDVQNYRGTLIVNSGAWQAQTKYQQTIGIVPTPGIAIAVNLVNLQPFQMDFNRINPM
jgi:DNA polymerase II small subunit